MERSNRPSKKGLTHNVLLEVTIAGLIDRLLNNTVLSMVVGICIVEDFQFLWRKWRGNE